MAWASRGPATDPETASIGILLAFLKSVSSASENGTSREGWL
jgi:hypothetical protein